MPVFGKAQIVEKSAFFAKSHLFQALNQFLAYVTQFFSVSLHLATQKFGVSLAHSGRQAKIPRYMNVLSSKHEYHQRQLSSHQP